MREIIAKGGELIQVDDSDFEAMSQRRWYVRKIKNAHYAFTSLDRRPRTMHRLLMNPPSKLVVDHIDGNGLNNQRSNLRVVTNQHNLWNIHVTYAKSGARGVFKKLNRWQAMAFRDGKYINVGSFKTRDAAIAARDEFLAKFYPVRSLLSPGEGQKEK